MSRVAKVLVPTALIAGSAMFIIPFLSTISTSMKTEVEMAQDPTGFIPHHPTLDNYAGAWNALPFATFLQNTLFITTLATFGALASASLVAYGFARFKFRSRNFLFYAMLATMMLPYQVTMIPHFLIWRHFGAIDTFFPLILPAFLGGGAFNIFLLRQFFLTIPTELDEAMLLDGAGYFGIWWRLILPLSKPALATILVFSFMGNWDNFESSLIYLNSPRNYTLSLGLRLFQDSNGSNFGQLMAGSVLHMLPMIVMFLFCQRYFIKGIATSGLGGR